MQLEEILENAKKYKYEKLVENIEHYIYEQKQQEVMGIMDSVVDIDRNALTKRIAIWKDQEINVKNNEEYDFLEIRIKVANAILDSLQPAVINSVAVPEWLTNEIRRLANMTWNEHKDTNDNKRVEAMRIIQRGALAAGYTIGIKKAMELLQQHCL